MGCGLPFVTANFQDKRIPYFFCLLHINAMFARVARVFLCRSLSVISGGQLGAILIGSAYVVGAIALHGGAKVQCRAQCAAIWG
jgi:hypothetical protein